MRDLNRAMIIGNVTRDPENRTTPQGTPVASFTVATNFTWTDTNGTRQQKTEFHPVVAWRKLAEICGQYVRKGRKVYVEGRIQTRSWEDQAGTKRYRTEIVADNVILLDRPGEGAAPAEATEATPEQPKGDSPNPPKEEKEEGEIKVEDIPF